MQGLSARQWEAVLFAACMAVSGACGSNSVSRGIAHTEEVYADTVDAAAAIGTIDSGLTSRYGERDRHAWEQIYRQAFFTTWIYAPVRRRWPCGY